MHNTSEINSNRHDPQNDFVLPVKVQSLEGLMNALKNAIADITDEDESAPIWFRGHKRKSYHLIPSLYRMLDQHSKFYKIISMRDALVSLAELFKARAYNAPELIGNESGIKTGYLISMQHYSIPTNILDWTTSAFVAMYFALENEINDKVNQDDDENAVIYLGNPIRLNIAREIVSKSPASRNKKSRIKISSSIIVRR